MGKNFFGDVPMEKHGSFHVRVPANTGDTDVKHAIARVPWDIKVIAAYVMFQGAITGADTNFVTPTIINAGLVGTGADVVASKAYTSGVDAVALVAEALTNSVTPANLLVSAGEVLAYLSNMTGSSVFDDLEKVVQVDYQIQ